MSSYNILVLFVNDYDLKNCVNMLVLRVRGLVVVLIGGKSYVFGFSESFLL